MDDSSKKPVAGRTADGRTRKPARRAAPAAQGVGNALRSVYDEAMEEAVPQELLDLLGKLG